MRPGSVRRAGPDRLRLVVHVAVALVAVAAAGWAALRWSLIAVAVDGRVATTSTAEEGPAYKVLNLEDGRILTIDDDLYDRMGGADHLPGAVLRTQARERSITVDGRPVPLRVASESWRVLVAAAALGAVGVVRVWRSAPEDGPGPGAERSPGP